VPRDYAQALHWFRLAADQGNTFAAFNLGMLYADGHGVPRDPREATKWLQQSAGAGNELAIAQLGKMGVPVAR
jgi:TPR repeat protein